jgi:hypothetical protein
VFGEPLIRSLARFGIDGKIVPIAFGADALGVQAIPRSPAASVGKRRAVAVH